MKVSGTAKRGTWIIPSLLIGAVLAFFTATSYADDPAKAGGDTNLTAQVIAVKIDDLAHKISAKEIKKQAYFHCKIANEVRQASYGNMDTPEKQKEFEAKKNSTDSTFNVEIARIDGEIGALKSELKYWMKEFKSLTGKDFGDDDKEVYGMGAAPIDPISTYDFIYSNCETNPKDFIQK
jgi:hypothetical protein